MSAKMTRFFLIPVVATVSLLLVWADDRLFHADKRQLFYYLDGDGVRHPVRTRSDWQKRKGHILTNMQLVMGPLPKRKKMPLDIVVLEEVHLAAYTRKKLTLVSEKGDRVPAYLLIPNQPKGRLPAVVCLHQTVDLGKGEPVGLGGRPNLHYAHELAERGYVTIAPDYPYLGEYQTDPYAMGYASATMKGICNHRRAVDLLESLPEVDGKRIGAIGHSLGGHNTLFLGVFDERVRAMVTSCGFNSFEKYFGGNLAGWSSKFYMPRIAAKYGNSPAQMPFDFPEVLAALAPRPVFINAPLGDNNFEVSGVRDCVEAARPIYEKIFEAGDGLVAVYPDAGHDFPPATRQAAYQFLDKWLKDSK